MNSFRPHRRIEKHNTMSATIYSKTRSCARQLFRQKRLQTQCFAYIAARRWKSDEPERKWSTPLAKQLSEAITVIIYKCPLLMSMH